MKKRGKELHMRLLLEFFSHLQKKKKNLQRGIIFQVHRIHELLQYRQILCCYFWHLTLARCICWWKGHTRV